MREGEFTPSYIRHHLPQSGTRILARSFKTGNDVMMTRVAERRPSFHANKNKFERRATTQKT